jgi:hypothetical protein
MLYLSQPMAITTQGLLRTSGSALAFTVGGMLPLLSGLVLLPMATTKMTTRTAMKMTTVSAPMPPPVSMSVSKSMLLKMWQMLPRSPRLSPQSFSCSSSVPVF